MSARKRFGPLLLPAVDGNQVCVHCRPMAGATKISACLPVLTIAHPIDIVSPPGMLIPPESLKAGVHNRSIPPYFTGTIKCSYGVPPHIIHGPPERRSDEKTAGSSCPVEKTMMWGGDVTHGAPAGGRVANGSVLLASLAPWSI